MDYFSTMRLTPWSPGYLFDHYAIYSIIFFAIGLAQLMSQELRKQVKGFNINNYIHVLRALVFILLVSHAIQVSYNLYKQPKESGKSSEELYINKQYNITRGLATPYWEIVDAAIESHKK